MDDTPSFLPHRWTPIAERSRDFRGRSLLVWEELPTRALSLSEAHALAAKGVILMASRHLPDRVELVVRPAPPGSAAAS